MGSKPRAEIKQPDRLVNQCNLIMMKAELCQFINELLRLAGGHEDDTSDVPVPVGAFDQIVFHIRIHAAGIPPFNSLVACHNG